MKNAIIAISMMMLIFGCTSNSDKKTDSSTKLSAIDFQEAEQVREVLNMVPGAQGKFMIHPSPSNTVVYIDQPDRPRKKRDTRTVMKQIKAHLAATNEREAKPLTFVFKETTLTVE